MKETVTVLRTLRNASLVAFLGIAMSSSVGAQPGPGPGRGMTFNKDNTPGWTLMTPQERAEHRDKMLSLKTYEECKAFQTEHRTAMEARAKETGKTLRIGRQNGCDRMKARGLIK